MQTTELSLTPNAAAEAVVDLDAIGHNVRVLRDHAGSAQVMAVVKADGYGHGATPVARAALAAGAANSAWPPSTRRWRCAATASPRRCWRGCTAGHRLRSRTAGRRPGGGVVGAPARRGAGRGQRTGHTATITVKVDTGLNRNGVGAAEYPRC